MNKILISLAGTLLSAAAFAGNADRLHISNIDVNKGNEQITVNMNVNPKDYRIKGNEIVELTPAIVSDSDTLRLPSVRIAGREAWFTELRDGHATPATIFRAGKGETINYSATTPLPEAFEHSTLIVLSDTASLCNCNPPKEGMVPIAEFDFRVRKPSLAFHYVAPKDSAEKIFNLSGKAKVIFKVNRTEIDWSYSRNYAELDSILRTIQAIKDNPDASVEAIYLAGYASPEGSYSNNVRLAKGRTEAVKDYVVSQSTFPASIYHTGFVPEDWAGLREWLVDNNIDGREQMIEFIDDPTIGDAERNDVFSRKFPEQYKFLLKNVYPELRHTDYRITYKIRGYHNIDEIREVLRTNPGNLSLNELFLLANSIQPGTEEYDNVFETAAALFPENDTANLNAANSAMNRGDLSKARFYLDRAGSTPEADYARGILALMQEDYESAEPLLQRGAAAGIEEAGKALEQLSRFKNFKGEVVIL
ncbi:MAG: OmpA family protein [Muribaculaceae bacterium]|nr:OmpA family protein [Muribaculaceae bacterium]